MAITVIATVGSVSANSFQTVAEIDTYYGARVPTSVATQWLEADPADKDAAAVMATTQMMALIRWTGYATTTTQALAWPREGMMDWEDREYFANNVIPQELKNAHAEFARILLLSDRLEESDVYNQGMTGFKAGPVSMTFREYTPPVPGVIPSFVTDLLIPSWIDSVKGQSGMRDLERT